MTNPKFTDCTLWDYFAGQALNRISAGNMITKPDQVAAECSAYADAMLAERNRHAEKERNVPAPEARLPRE